MTALIEIKELNFAYGDRPLLWQRLSFNFSHGQRIGIVGPNGSGKSTLFNLIMGLIRPTSGQIFLNQQLCTTEADFSTQRTGFGYAFQDPDDQLFCPTLFDDIAFGPRNLGFNKSMVDSHVKEAMERFKLSHLAQHSVYHLSGGEKRLAAMACIWAMQPKALLLDEPSLSLDKHHYDILVNNLLHSQLSWIIISHDHDFLSAVCNEMWLVENRKLIPASSVCFT